MTAWLFTSVVGFKVWHLISLIAVAPAGYFWRDTFGAKKLATLNAQYAQSGVITGFGAGYQDALHKVAASIDSGCDLKEIRRALEQCEIPIRERNDSELVH